MASRKKIVIKSNGKNVQHINLDEVAYLSQTNKNVQYSFNPFQPYQNSSQSQNGVIKVVYKK